MLKRIFLALVFVVLLLLCLLLAAYLALPQLTDIVAEEVFPPELQLQSLNIGSANDSSAVVDDLHFSYQSESGLHVAVQARGISLAYYYKELLQGRVDSLLIEQLDVQLLALGDKQASTAPELALASILPQQYLALMPSDDIHLKKIVFDWSAANNSRLPSTMDGSARLVDGQLSAQFSAPQGWQADVSIATNNFLAAVLSHADQQLVKIGLEPGLDPSDAQTLQLDAELDITGLYQSDLLSLLPEQEWPQHVSGLEGMAELSSTILLPPSLNSESLSELQAEGSLAAEVSVKSNENDVLECIDPSNELPIAAAFTFAQQQLELKFESLDCSLSIAPQRLPPAMAELADINELYIKLAAQQGSLLSIDTLSNTLQFNEGEFSAFLSNVVQSQSSVAHAKIVLAANHSHDATVHVDYTIPELRYAPYMARNVKGDFSASVDVKNAAEQGFALASPLGSGMAIRFNKGARLVAQQFTWLEGSASDVQLRGTGQASLLLDSQTLSFADVPLRLTASKPTMLGQQYAFSGVALSAKNFTVDMDNPRQLSGKLKAQLDELIVPVGELRSQPLSMTAKLSFSDSKVGGDVKLWSQTSDAAIGIESLGKIQHDMTRNKGGLSLELQDLNFTEAQTFLPKLFSQWPLPFDLSAGRLDGAMKFSWRGTNIDAQGNVALHDVGGFYQNNLFGGMNGTIQLQKERDNWALDSRQLQLDRIEAGLLLENLKLRIQGPLDALQFSDISADALGGAVTVADTMLNGKQLKVQLKGLQLNQILELESGVTGEGLLDGNLPVFISDEGVKVVDGKLRARSPGGVLRYTGDVQSLNAVNNPQLNLALEALQNFHYDVLDIDANYAEDGQLSLKAKLQGRNPDLQNARPVNFNLSISESIPALLESLRLTQDISDSLDKRIRAFYEDN